MELSACPSLCLLSFCHLLDTLLCIWCSVLPLPLPGVLYPQNTKFWERVSWILRWLQELRLSRKCVGRPFWLHTLVLACEAVSLNFTKERKTLQRWSYPHYCVINRISASYVVSGISPFPTNSKLQNKAMLPAPDLKCQCTLTFHSISSSL